MPSFVKKHYAKGLSQCSENSQFFFVLFQNVDFLKFKTHFWQSLLGKILIFLPSNNFELLRTKISPRRLSCTHSVKFYEQLKIDSFCKFCPQNNILPEPTGNTVEPGPDSSLVFQLLILSVMEGSIPPPFGFWPSISTNNI